jgi:hypothetical protein
MKKLERDEESKGRELSEISDHRVDLNTLQFSGSLFSRQVPAEAEEQYGPA